jgi:hypothetical protein
MRLWWAALLVATACAACDEPARFLPSHTIGDMLDVRDDSAVIRTGRVGSGQFEGTGTYALVDVGNPLSVDVEATLEGDLLDGDGNRAGALNRESLRIPAGAQRTFALVHHTAPVPSAIGADVRVSTARLAAHAPTIGMSDANVYEDGNRVVVAANLTNKLERETIVVVIAGFYDGDGHIMQRPHSVIRIPGELTKPARFVGPDGSRSGYLFVGEQIH